MDPSTKHRSNSPSKELALYDKFIKGLSKDEGASSKCDVMESTPEQKQFLEKIYEPVKRDKVYGFDYDEKSLKMLLLNLNERSCQDNSFKLIGVVGMLGVGKTALCRLILDEEEVKQRFVPRLWIPMSEEPCSRSMEKVVERMLEHLGVEEEIINFISKDHKLPGLLYALHLQLIGKKFLIVLDDVQEPKEEHYFEKVKEDAPKEVKEELKKKCGGLPLVARIMGESSNQPSKRTSGDDSKDDSSQAATPSGDDVQFSKKDEQKEEHYYEKLMSCLSKGHGFPKGYGGAVILTSRNEEAIKKIVGEQNLHRLLPLSDPESCWSIYKTLAFGQDGVHEEVKKELKKKCGGLPLVARIMGELKHREKNQKLGSNQPSKRTSGDDSKDGSSQAPSNGSGLQPNQK